MIIDKRLQVSSQQAITGTDAVRSTDVIDLGSDRDIGPGQPLWLVVIARTGLGGTGGPTIKWSLQTDDSADFGSPTTLIEQPALAAAAFVSGTIFVLPLTMANERFLSVLYTMTGTSPTATIDAFLTSEQPYTWRALPGV